MPKVPQLLMPTWRASVWESIRNAPFERGGWRIDGRVHCLRVVRGSRSMDVEPLPDPDPPDMYRMPDEHWGSIAGGQLAADRNVIVKGGVGYRVVAVAIEEGRWALSVAS